MKVTAVTPSDAASNPQHPDHDRWVKETTLAMEVKHAQRSGRSFRDAEAENAHWLERAEAKARENKSAPTPSAPRKPGRKTREERLAERPVTRTFGKKRRKVLEGAQTSPCRRCGLCRRCKREKRIYAMALKAKREGDAKLGGVIKALWFESMCARDLTGKYAGMSRDDAERILERKLEDICDSTVMQMGPWL